MAAITRAATGIASEMLKVWDAVAHRIDKKPKDGFKVEGYTLSIIALINETAIKSFENVANLLKDAKVLSNLFYLSDTFIKGNKFIHKISGYFQGNATAYSVGLGALDVLIPFCDTMRVFNDYSIVHLDKALPLFTSITFKQFFGITGGAFLALRFAERSYQTFQDIRKPNLTNDRMKNCWKLVEQVALTALGTLLIAFNIMGVFYPIPILALSITSLIPNFAIQYIEDEEKRQRDAVLA